MDNYEFFMEASKNPDVKARKRTVNNLRRIGVDRAHEVDNKKLEEGVDINIKDSYGNNHKTKLTSKGDGKDSNSYSPSTNTININPKTMSSNKFDASFNHEAGHAEQEKRFGIGLDDTNRLDYTVSDKDDYPIKCAKLFLQKNKDKMNDHDSEWTELHADFLSCKKIGFGKMIKRIYSFKKCTSQIDALIDKYEKEHEDDCDKIRNQYLKINDKEGNERVLSDKEVDDFLASYKQAKEKLEKRENTIHERYDAIRNKYHNLLDNFDLSEEYMKKFDKLLDKLHKHERKTRDKIWDLEDVFEEKHGVSVSDVSKYKEKMLDEMNLHLKILRSTKALTTTYDYRAKFIEDMMNIHNGHPGRCSMKYPPMTPEDKKYMQEFTVEEMYLDNIITESEYIQLQERIQMITERSEICE